jgi:hypothetical protein
MDAYGDYKWEMNFDPAYIVSSGYNDDGSSITEEENKPQTLNI